MNLTWSDSWNRWRKSGDFQKTLVNRSQKVTLGRKSRKISIWISNESWFIKELKESYLLWIPRSFKIYIKNRYLKCHFKEVNLEKCAKDPFGEYEVFKILWTEIFILKFNFSNP